MTVLTAAGVAPHDEDLVLERAREVLDLPALLACGWDAETLVFAPPQSDELFGWTCCERVGCTRGGYLASSSRNGLCDGCFTNYRNTYQRKGVSIDEYKQMPYRATRRSPAGRRRLCLVCRTPGHERRARRGELCLACSNLQLSRGQTVATYVHGDDRFPPARPRPSLASCEVSGCSYGIEIPSKGICRACNLRLGKHLRREPGLDLASFKRRGMFSVLSDGRTVDLSGLPERVRLQFLLGLQRLLHLGMLAPPSELALVARRLHQQDVRDLRRLDHTRVANRNCAGRLAKVMVEAAEDAATILEEELQRDVWRVRILFPNERRRRRAVFSFEEISQPWLRELVKRYCASRLGELRPATLKQAVNRLGRFARFLSATGRGTTPAEIDRHDLDRYVSLIHAGSKAGHEEAAALGHLLRFTRRHGHTQPGGLAFGLGEDVVILDEDVKRRRNATGVEEEPGRAIPEYVIAQLMEPAALARLHPTFAAAVELAAHLGRRPSEVCDLDADCLVFIERAARDGEAQQRPAVRYRRHKPPIKVLTLPVHEETAALIRNQQRTVGQRFPGIPLRKLKLFPRPKMNPVGDATITAPNLSTRMRRWIDALPAIVDEEGEAFDRALIFPYALRHSYAQRHADAGTPLDVLQKLMDHRSPTTTQFYYRVRDERLFAAVRSIGPMTINANGERVPTLYPDADQLARSIGQIPVPLGHCVEPHNVKTLGEACPFSHQCLGCKWFRTDPSYLPDLYAYLERLLEARERLRAAVPELADWARKKALPNDDEIQAVRRLLRANTELLGELAQDERRTLEQLFGVLRAERARAENAIPIHHVAAVSQPEPTFEPAVFTPLPAPHQEVA